VSEHEAIVIASLGVIIASIATITTFVGIYLSNKRTKESNNMMQKEINIKLRPWIRIEGCKPTHGILASDAIMEWKDITDNNIHPVSVRLSSEFTNFGNTPCYFVSSMFKQKTVFNRDVLINDEMRKRNVGICMPQAKLNKDLIVPYEEWPKKPKQNFFVGVRIVYKLNESTEVETGTIWEIESGKNLVRDTWYEEVEKSTLEIQ